MALDFPASPTTNQTYTGPGGVIWVWDGAKWVNGTGITTAYAPIDSPAMTGNPTAPNPPAGDADTSVATTSFVSAAVGTALHDIGRNLLHNPLFNVAQRGVGPWTTSAYTLDRWLLLFSGDTGVSVQQIALPDTPRAQIGDEAATYCLQLTTTGNAAAGSYTEMVQCIEGVRRLAGKTITLSFWATGSSGTLKLGLNGFSSYGTGGSPSASASFAAIGTAITLTTTWVRYSATFTVPSANGKTFGTTAGTDFTELQIFLSSGATNNAQAGNIGVQSGTIQLWGVQLEIGSQATPLEKPDPRYDLSNCQRFYQTSAFTSYGAGAAGAAIRVPIPLRVTMRALPTVVPGYTATPGITSPSMAASSADMLTTSGTLSTTSYGMDGVYTASADL